MDSNVPTPITTNIENLPPVEPKAVPPSKNNQITIISIACFILLALGIVIFLYYQNQKLKHMLTEYTQPLPSPVISNDPLASWKLYKSTTDGYQLKVPQEWGQTEQLKTDAHKIVFQSADGLYRFTVDAQTNKNKATGKAYSSLDEFIGLPYAVKALKIDGQDSRQPMPRSGFENFDKVYFFSQDSSLIFSLELLVGDGTKTDHRVTFEALQIGSDIFDKVISTYKFLEPKKSALPVPTTTDSASPSAKACTQEAKVCPNGSSVGRHGPNCEFDPCPTTQ